MDIVLGGEAATARLGEDIAAVIRPGDVLALKGDLGAGKSTLARALIRALADDDALDVPSPTFTLVQDYATAPPVAHFDLYRLGSAQELEELGLSEAMARGAVLVEWPERAEGALPGETLTVELTGSGGERRAALRGEGPFCARVLRSLAARDFLEDMGWGEAVRRRLTGDASARSYDRIRLDDEPERLLMNAPPLVLGPPVRGNMAYAEIAHSARSVHAFVAVDEALAQAGFAVPDILAADLEGGFLLIDDLGSDGILDGEGRPIPERYEASGALLADLHRWSWKPRIAAREGFIHEVPPFDRAALLIEAELLLDWFVPWRSGQPATDALRETFRTAWNGLIDRLEASEQSLVLRDHHSPNIIWREEREGNDRIGLLDFQDALIGPAAYDVASLAMDARVSIPPELEERVCRAYEAARAGDANFDTESFREAFAICAAQRNTKILGIFVRLKQRDGKPGYIAHLPRIQDYLKRALAHPALAELQVLYAREGFLA